MLERVAQWTLTDVWRPPAGLKSKGGSPRGGADARAISTHLRLMADVYARTGDPFFLAVPRLSLVEGFGENAQPFGTRSTGLVFNYLPWMLAALKEHGDPQPEPQFDVRPQQDEVGVERGGGSRLCFAVQNAGSSAVKDLRVSFHSRLDLPIQPERAAPRELKPGEVTQLCYTIKAPSRINLNSEYNRIAYGHWSALYRREGRAHVAHRSIKITIKAFAKPRLTPERHKSGA